MPIKRTLKSTASLLALAREFCQPAAGEPNADETLREAAAGLLSLHEELEARREAAVAARSAVWDAAARFRLIAQSQQPGLKIILPKKRRLVPELPEPSAPHGFVVYLEKDGIALTWKARQVGLGVTYSIQRRKGTSGEFRQIGTTGSDCFHEDRDMAALLEGVEYRVVPRRRGRAGPIGPTIRVALGLNGECRPFIRDLAETPASAPLALAA